MCERWVYQTKSRVGLSREVIPIHFRLPGEQVIPPLRGVAKRDQPD